MPTNIARVRSYQKPLFSHWQSTAGNRLLVPLAQAVISLYAQGRYHFGQWVANWNYDNVADWSGLANSFKTFIVPNPSASSVIISCLVEPAETDVSAYIEGLGYTFAIQAFSVAAQGSSNKQLGHGLYEIVLDYPIVYPGEALDFAVDLSGPWALKGLTVYDKPAPYLPDTGFLDAGRMARGRALSYYDVKGTYDLQMQAATDLRKTHATHSSVHSSIAMLSADFTSASWKNIFATSYTAFNGQAPGIWVHPGPGYANESSVRCRIDLLARSQNGNVQVKAIDKWGTSNAAVTITTLIAEDPTWFVCYADVKVPTTNYYQRYAELIQLVASATSGTSTLDIFAIRVTELDTAAPIAAPSGGTDPVVTRLYFSRDAEPVTPADNGVWNATLSSWTAGCLATTKTNSALEEMQIGGLDTALYTYIGVGRFTSPPLAADTTISGAVSVQLSAEYWKTATIVYQAMDALELYVVSNDGATVKGELANIGSKKGTNFNLSSPRNKTFADNITLNPVEAVAGDRIACKVGCYMACITSPDLPPDGGFGIVAGDPTGVDEFGVNESDTAEKVPWLEFDSVITFS